MFNADSRLSQLLSWEVLCPKWIALLIIADSTIMVTFVVLTRMIGLPKFAMVLSEWLVRSKGEAHLITISAVPSGKGFFAFCTALVKFSLLACTANAGLVQRSVTVAAESLTA